MRILIATVTAGGGHLAAAAAQEEAWRATRPRDGVERVDLVKFFSKVHKAIHRGGYDELVEHAPELWGMLFKQTDNPAHAHPAKALSATATHPPLVLTTTTPRLSGDNGRNASPFAAAICSHNRFGIHKF